MGMMRDGARDANLESAARAGYGKVAEQAARIAELEAALREAVEVWASHLNSMPNVRSRKRLDEVRALVGE